MGRERKMLDRAKERGYLDPGRRPKLELEREYGRWCWKFRLPMVRVERNSVYSRYSRLHLDLCGTPNTLSEAGVAQIRKIIEQAGGFAAGQVNEVGGVWGHIQRTSVAIVAREVFKAATTLGYYQPDWALFERRQAEFSMRLDLKPQQVQQLRKWAAGA